MDRRIICSSALPAVFTHVLSVAELPTLSYYLYILLYVCFFMLDDLIIFTAAAYALKQFSSEKYARYCHVLGGVIMFGLGVLLTFFPQHLF
jgi:threonine/homoserine/homoserine lactone efflux protein